MTDQLELSLGGSFAVRLLLTDALQIFWDTDWSHTSRASNTRKCFERISEFFKVAGIRYVDEVTKASVEDMRRTLGNAGLKANTVNTHHMILTRFFNALNEWQEARWHHGIDFANVQLPRKNPAAQVPKVDERQFARKVAWPKRLVRRIIETAKAMDDIDMAEIIEVLYGTRLRPGDVFLMTDRNVDLVRLILSGIQHKTITRRLPSGIPYLIAIPKRCLPIFRRRVQTNASGDPLFREPQTKIRTWMNSIRKRFHIISTAAKAGQVQLRDFRPSSATLLLDNGIDPETVKDLLGHTTLRMLPSYAPRTLLHQRRAHETLEKDETEILI